MKFEFPRFIAFFGPDGTGKSTQAELLVSRLRKKGIKVKRVWIRSVHTFAFLLWRLFRILNLCRSRYSSSLLVSGSKRCASSPINDPPILNGSVSRFIWSSVENASVVPVILLRVYIPLLMGYVVVADRYVLDSIASMAYFTRQKEREEKPLTLMQRILLRLVPNGALFIYVDADYTTISNRRPKSAGPPEYTQFYKSVYTKLAPLVDAVRVDTSNMSIGETSQKIWELVLRERNKN